VVVNCGGLPEGTIDSELFGHVKGAFTGALNDRKGYFEEADGSTIFLDEVGELPLATQARLLRVLEAGEYYRVGNSEIRKTNVRVIAATNVDLHKAIREGRFREDLYYRLSTISIEVPPLRERPEDIYLLFRKFAGDIATKYKMPAITLTAEAQRKLQAYTWPGNVRQLLHLVEEMSIVERDREISAEILSHYLPQFDERISLADDHQSETFKPGEKELLYKVIFELRKELDELKQAVGLGGTSAQTPHATATANTRALPMGSGYTPIVTPAPGGIALTNSNPLSTPANLATPTVTTAPASSIEAEEQEIEELKTLEKMERDAIEASLRRNHGLKKKVAEELGISERTLYRKINDYNLDHEFKN
jgi:DNA-binding NtrC family response regulator